MTDDALPAFDTEKYTHEAPDGTPLSVRVFRPEEPGPYPVLLQRTPYGKPEDPSGRALARQALGAGYAVAYEDTRGRGESGGAFRPWVHEAADGAATVEWLAARPWSTGRVGTYGGSTPGQVQLLLAAERPEGLAAIAPMFAPSDLHRADFFQDGAMSALTLLTWSLEAVAGHTADRLRDAGDLSPAEADAVHEAIEDALQRIEAVAASRPLTDLPERVLGGLNLPVDPGDVVPHWAEWTARPSYDEFWGSFDVETTYDRIGVPGLHVTGWWELCQQGTTTNFAGLRERSAADQHLIVGPWTHQDTSGASGALAFGDRANTLEFGLYERHIAFFDTYLREEPRAPFDGGRHVETFRTTVECEDGPAGGGEWTTHGDWPPRGAATERWYLTSDGDAAGAGGRLAQARPGKFEPPDRWVHDPADPVPTRGGPLCCGEAAPDAGPVDQRPVEARDDVLTYTTPPLESGVELAGPVEARLVAGTDAADTDFTAKLVHVTDDGAYNLCEGIRRARYRHGRDRVSPVGDPMRVVVDMWDAHHRVPPGDRLRLEVASSNFPRFDAHPGTADPWEATDEEARPAAQTLYHERDRESALVVTRR